MLLPLAIGLLWTSSLDSPGEVPYGYFYRPQDTIATYWHSMIERRHLQALDCFADTSPKDVHQMLGLPDLVELRCRDFEVADRGRGIVDVAYTVEYRVSMGDALAQFRTGDRLIFTPRGWRISAPLLMAGRGG
jgi:hypothetical protein